MPTIHELVRDHLAEVYGYAFRLAGNRPDADDLTQQTFLTAQVCLDQLRDAAAARVWLWTITRRTFLAQRRKLAPVAVPDLSQHERASAPPLSAMPVDGLALDRESLDRALAELSDEARLVLTRFYFEDATYREMADEMEVPLGTIMSRLSRAKARLRTLLLRNAETKPRAEVPRPRGLESPSDAASLQVTPR